jgi:hypothetical protein
LRDPGDADDEEKARDELREVHYGSLSPAVLIDPLVW